MTRTPIRFLLLLPLALSPAAARADNLDAALVEQAGPVFQKLSGMEVRTVGVLPFRIVRGDRPESFVEGPLSAGMPVRLENLLVMANKAGPRAIKILGDPAAHASRSRVGAWSSDPKALARLFELKYPLAWDPKAREVPDAFLTGVFRNTGDRTTTKVTIEVILRSDVLAAAGAKKPRALLRPLVEFEVDTDRVLLGELGYSYTLPLKDLAGKRSTLARNQLAVRGVRARDQGESRQGAATPEDVGGLRFRILYNGTAQDILPVSGDNPESGYYVKPIDPGTTVTFEVQHNGTRDQLLGAVVRVNGESCLDRQTGDPGNLRRYLYRAGGAPDIYEGYYLDGAPRANKFEVVDAEEALRQSPDLGQRIGLIEVDVFASGDQPPDEEMTISTRGLSRRGKSGVTAGKVEDLRARLTKANGFTWMPHVRGGIIQPGKEISVVPPKKADFPNPVHVGHLLIRYYDPEKLTISN